MSSKSYSDQLVARIRPRNYQHGGCMEWSTCSYMVNGLWPLQCCVKVCGWLIISGRMRS